MKKQGRIYINPSDVNSMDYQMLLSGVKGQTGFEQELAKISLTKYICKSFGHEWGLKGDVQIGGEALRWKTRTHDLNHMKLAASFEKYM